MATFNELMQKMVNSDYSVLVSFAQEALVNLLPACKKVDPENDGLFMATSIILSAIGADGVLTGLEKKMLADALGQNFMLLFCALQPQHLVLRFPKLIRCRCQCGKRFLPDRFQLLFHCVFSFISKCF